MEATGETSKIHPGQKKYQDGCVHLVHVVVHVCTHTHVLSIPNTGESHHPQIYKDRAIEVPSLENLKFY